MWRREVLESATADRDRSAYKGRNSVFPLVLHRNQSQTGNQSPSELQQRYSLWSSTLHRPSTKTITTRTTPPWSSSKPPTVLGYCVPISSSLWVQLLSLAISRSPIWLSIVPSRLMLLQQLTASSAVSELPCSTLPSSIASYTVLLSIVLTFF